MLSGLVCGGSGGVVMICRRSAAADIDAVVTLPSIPFLCAVCVGMSPSLNNTDLRP